MGNWPTARKQIIPKIFHKMLQGRHQLSCIAWCGDHQFRPIYMFLYIPKWFQDFCNIFSTQVHWWCFLIAFCEWKICSLKWVVSSSPQILWIPQPWKSAKITWKHIWKRCYLFKQNICQGTNHQCMFPFPAFQEIFLDSTTRFAHTSDGSTFGRHTNLVPFQRRACRIQNLNSNTSEVLFWGGRFCASSSWI